MTIDNFNERSNNGDEPDAYARLLRMIVELELKPGSLFSESALQELLETDRAGLRGALDLLKQIQLISIIPRAGVMIAPISFLEIQTIFEARLALEPAIIRLAAVRAFEAEIKELQALNKALRSGIDEAVALGWSTSNLVRLVDLDRTMHARFARLAQNSILEETMNSILIRNSRILNLFFRSLEGDRRSNHFISHDDIVRAIADHDPDAAERAIRQHLDNSWSLLQSAFLMVPGSGVINHDSRHL